MKNGKSLLEILIWPILAAIVIGNYYYQDYGAKVVLRNISRNIIEDVCVNGIMIGNLKCGEIKKVLLYPKGESGLFIEYNDKLLRKKYPINSYFESGYRERFYVDLVDNNVPISMNVSQKILTGIGVQFAPIVLLTLIFMLRVFLSLPAYKKNESANNNLTSDA